MTKRMLVSDIDGTLLRDGEGTAGLDVLRRILAVHRETVALVYATGRSFVSTWSLVEEGLLPTPDAVASFVGTEIWFPDWSRPDEEHRRRLWAGWDRVRAAEVVSGMPGVVPQPDEFQSELKASFVLDANRTVFDVESLLARSGVEARVIYSCGKYLDILPSRGGKRSAVEYLREVWGVAADEVLACGDSGNDVDMLTDPRTMGVAVGNSEFEIFDLPDHSSLYKAVLPFASGVLEGAAAFGFWPSLSAGAA